MDAAAKISGSWRPQLWLARRCLEAKQLSTARSYYAEVLAAGGDQADAWMMLSGDLGNNGYLAEMIELLLPSYEAERHGALAGLNLLQACLETQRLDEGEQLLHALFALNRPDLKDRLFQFSADFDKLRAGAPGPAPPVDDELAVRVVPIARPIWVAGLHDAEWLVPSVDERAEKVTLVPLAIVTAGKSESIIPQREDDLGRLTRSFSLYLLESIYAWTQLRPVLAVPVVSGSGPVVWSGDWPAEHVLSFAGDSALAVTGSLEEQGDTLRVRLAIWDCAKRQIARRFQYSTTWNSLGATILRAEEEVVGSLAGNPLPPSPCLDFYQRPDAAAMPHYLSCLGQTLMISLVHNEVVSRAHIWGERNILQYCVGLTLQMPTPVSKLMFLAAVVKNEAYGSQIYREFKREALQVLADESNRDSPLYRLSPLIYRIYDPELFHLRKGELLPDAQGDYRAWLESLQLD